MSNGLFKLQDTSSQFALHKSKSTCSPKNCFLIHKTNKCTTLRTLGKADHRDHIKVQVNCHCNGSAVASIELLKQTECSKDTIFSETLKHAFKNDAFEFLK